MGRPFRTARANPTRNSNLDPAELRGLSVGLLSGPVPARRTNPPPCCAVRPEPDYDEGEGHPNGIPEATQHDGQTHEERKEREAESCKPSHKVDGS